MSSLHAIRRERQGLRLVQAKAVMPKIGPLLDAWEGVSSDAKEQMREEAPTLCEYLDKIADAMEGSLAAEEANEI